MPPFPIRAEGVTEGTRPPLPVAPSPTPAPLAAPPRYVREGGTGGHATGGPSLPHSRGRGCARAYRPPPLPVAPGTSPPPLGRATPYVRMGAREGTQPGPTFPHSRGRGCTRARDSLSPSLPAPPLLATPPICVEMGHPSTHATPALPFPFVRKGCTRADAPGRPGAHRVHATLYAQTRGTRVHAAPAPAPAPPFPLVRASPFTRKGGMQGQAAPSRGAPVHVGMGAQGQAASSSRAGAVSMRPRSPRPHPVYVA
ncbi:hypothetical protein EDB83DRAFT_2527154 [Lactarius deliciosus]|nr:hypothetical protein EDB83DRAFT_2527154 [Lactarius deliciosus]